MADSNNPQHQENGESDVAVKNAKPKLAAPRKYAVILHNDDYTTMEFVTEVLIKFFQKTEEQAVQVMLSVHHNGKGVAGVYSREIAETKVAQVEDYARTHEHPLKCTYEPTE